MPLKYFNCKAGQIPIAECWGNCPNTEGRCLSLPTLHEVGRKREWTGKPSTTQLLNPLRLIYLELTKDYAIDPKSMAFALLGTRHHQRLESVAKMIEGLESEKQLTGEVTVILDLLEPDELFPGYFKLVDYKTWGSYAVAKALGLKDNAAGEVNGTALQLNNYRIMAKSLGFKISRLLVQCTVRDGGTRYARDNHIFENIITIPIDMLPDNAVIDYFATKKRLLLEYLETQIMPPLCDYEDRWAGRRCRGYCDIFMYCPEGAKVNKVELQQ